MKGRLSPATKLAIKALGNVLLVAAMHKWLPQYFSVFGGWPAYVIVGALLTLLNVFLRPALKIVTAPLHFFFAFLADIIVNAVYIYIVYRITMLMDPELIVVVITGGLWGWVVITFFIGFGNWVMKKIVG